MTKEQFIYLYGEVEACSCDNCGHYFLPEEAGTSIEPHGEEWPTCPHCGCGDLRYHDSSEMRFEDEEEGEEE